MPKKNPKRNPEHLARMTRKGYTPPQNPESVPVQSSQRLLHKTLEHHMDILQNMEFAALQIYRLKPDLVDVDVIHAYNALFAAYSDPLFDSEKERKMLEALAEPACAVYDVVRQMGELRFVDDEDRTMCGTSHLSLEARKTLRDCITCLLDSAKFWHAQNGSTGYLDYVSQFINQMTIVRV